MDKLPNNEVYRELFTAKKTLYNDQHNVSIRNVPVEVYVQDTNEPVNSLGEYSVVNDKWIRIPKKQRANFDQAATKAKYENLAELVDLAIKTADLDRVKKLIDMIRRYRKAGLSKGGEFSPENLAYKAVRSQGAIDALYDLRDTLHGDELSIEEASSREDAIIRINKIKNTAGRTENEIEMINGIIEKLMKQYNIRPKEIGMSQGISSNNYPSREPVDPLKARMAKAAYEKQQAAAELKKEWENFKSRFFKEDAETPAATTVSRIATELKKFARPLGVTAELRQMPEAYFPALELTDLYADKLGTGAGSKVMTELARLADEAGLNVYLRPSNQGNKAFYAKFGFVKDAKHFAMMVRYPAEEPDEDDVLEEGYTTKQQVIDHFVRMARKRGENVNIARQKGAGAWERGWRGGEPKKPKEPNKPKEIRPYDPERYKNVRLPYSDVDEGCDMIKWPKDTVSENWAGTFKNSWNPWETDIHINPSRQYFAKLMKQWGTAARALISVKGDLVFWHMDDALHSEAADFLNEKLGNFIPAHLILYNLNSKIKIVWNELENFIADEHGVGTAKDHGYTPLLKKTWIKVINNPYLNRIYGKVYPWGLDDSHTGDYFEMTEEWMTKNIRPKESKPYDTERYKPRLPYKDDDDETNEDYDPVNETEDRKAAVLKIQKHLNKKYGANLDLDGKLGPLTLKSINKFMPRAKTGLADEPNKTTAVQGKKLKETESKPTTTINFRTWQHGGVPRHSFVVVRDGKKIAYGEISKDNEWDDDRGASVQDIVVHTDYRRKGFATKIYNEIERKFNYKLHPSDDVKPDGQEFWKARSNLDEASGYIPSAKEKNDPRFKTALTVDVRPDAIKKNAKAFGFKTSRAGIPPQARADGKIK
jgi:ribosomal protein S18 acetylase RimI-like enzyme